MERVLFGVHLWKQSINILLASSLSHWGARSYDPQTVLPGSLGIARKGGGGGVGGWEVGDQGWGEGECLNGR